MRRRSRGDEASRFRPGAIRGYSADLARARADRDALRAGFASAVDRGEILAWFQPQICPPTPARSAESRRWCAGNTRTRGVVAARRIPAGD
jgi:hypothetical protein